MSGFMTVSAQDSDFALGREHARTTAALTPEVHQWVDGVQRRFPMETSSVSKQIHAVEAVLQRHSPATLNQLAGMAQIYGVDKTELLAASLGTYLESSDQRDGRSFPAPDRGCSTFACNTPDGPVLVKNRDTSSSFRDMQTVLHVRPTRGNAWLAVSTAGAPDVHSSGINERGLAVADTHVPSFDVGPGLPRFSAMRRVLEECSTTAQALELLDSMPMLGLGNIIVGDRSAHFSVVECGHSGIGVVDNQADFVVATNHYVSAECAGSNHQTATSRAGENSRQRRAWLDAELSAAPGAALRAPWDALTHHCDGASPNICVHSKSESETVSSVVFRLDQPSAELAHGHPCLADVQDVELRLTGPG